MAIRRRRDMSVSASEGEGNSVGEITFILLVVSVTYILLTSPANVSDVISNALWDPYSRKREAQVTLLQCVMDLMAYCNSAVNMLLYCVSGSKFRQELKSLFRSCKC